MKTKILTLIALGCLVFASCKKDEANNPDVPKEEVLQINGKEYEIDFLKRGLSRLLAIPLDKLVYDEQAQVFRHTYFAMALNPVAYIEDIETIKREGYEF